MVVLQFAIKGLTPFTCFVPIFFYYRLTILPSEEKIAPMHERLSKFHKEFMDKYKEDKEN